MRFQASLNNLELKLKISLKVTKIFIKKSLETVMVISELYFR